jgi:hypothetical protein
MTLVPEILLNQIGFADSPPAVYRDQRRFIGGIYFRELFELRFSANQGVHITNS